SFGFQKTLPSRGKMSRKTGEDEQSTEMAARWEDEKVTEAASEGFVAIKIDTKSEACLQFSQICILLTSVQVLLYNHRYLFFTS
uniref:Uncharacterized protein n=1 Tax=Nothoprocta perdicaria TaxID=30464 RepID=A0A8C6YNM7_NOTPE